MRSISLLAPIKLVPSLLIIHFICPLLAMNHFNEMLNELVDSSFEVNFVCRHTCKYSIASFCVSRI